LVSVFAVDDEIAATILVQSSRVLTNGVKVEPEIKFRWTLLVPRTTLVMDCGVVRAGGEGRQRVVLPFSGRQIFGWIFSRQRGLVSAVNPQYRSDR